MGSQLHIELNNGSLTRFLASNSQDPPSCSLHSYMPANGRWANPTAGPDADAPASLSTSLLLASTVAALPLSSIAALSTSRLLASTVDI